MYIWKESSNAFENGYRLGIRNCGDGSGGLGRGAAGEGRGRRRVRGQIGKLLGLTRTITTVYNL